MTKNTQNSSNIQDARALFLVNVYDMARKHGEATTGLIALLKSGKIKWSNATQVGIVADEFKVGRVAGMLAISRAQAQAVIAKKPFKLGKPLDDTMRTDVEHKAVRAAISAWSYVSGQAGAPSAQTGAKRAPKARDGKTSSEQGATNPDASEENTLTSVPRAKTYEDVAAFALRVADTLRKFENRNAGVKFLAYRAIFETFVASVQAETRASKDIPNAPAMPPKKAPKLVATSVAA